MRKYFKRIITFAFVMMAFMPFAMASAKTITSDDIDAAYSSAGTNVNGITFDSLEYKYVLAPDDYTVGTDLEANLSFTSGESTIDLNGKTIAGSISASDASVEINGSGTVTYGVTANASSNVTINGGNYNAALMVDGGELVINDATVEPEGADAIYVFDDSSLVVNGGVFTSEYSALCVESIYGENIKTIIINGGVFTGKSAAIMAGNFDSLVINGGVFTATSNFYAFDTKSAIIIMSSDANAYKTIFDSILGTNASYSKTITPLNYEYYDEYLDTTTYFAYIDTDTVTVSAEEASYTVSFETNGGTSVGSQTYKASEKTSAPTEPTKTNYEFKGWYTDSNLTTAFTWGNKLTSNVTLYAKWEKVEEKAEETKEEDTKKEESKEEEKNEETVKETTYTINDDNGNSISFNEDENIKYTFSIMDIMSLTDEEVVSLGGTKEQLQEIVDGTTKATKEYGALIKIYEIVVSNNGQDLHNADGGFTVKIKMTDEMKKYNTFKLIFVDDDFTTEKPIELTISGDYLVGTLKHLSGYALVGSNVETAPAKTTGTTTVESTNSLATSNPKTGDNIVKAFILVLIGVAGLVGIKIYQSKKKES